MTHTSPPLLSLRHVRKDRLQGQGAAYCLHVPHLDVRAGEKVLITGPSGCGKSTMLDLIGMVLKPDMAGVFTLAPAESTVLNIAAAWQSGEVENLTLWRRNIGYVLQTGGLLPFVSVRENILIPRKLLRLPADSTVDGLAKSLGITHLLDKLPAQLSVGERQRVAIARALAPRPALVLADEPTAALDPANASGVLALFSRMVAELGTTLILVTHAPEQVRGMGFRPLCVQLEEYTEAGVTGTRAVLSDGVPEEGLHAQKQGLQTTGGTPCTL